MTKWLRKELLKANKEKRRCKRLYKDWEDNEYNCGPLKFIFAVTSEENKSITAPIINPSFHTLNDLLITYNRDTKKYLLDLEVGYYQSQETELDYLKRLLQEFTAFMNNDEQFSNDLASINTNAGNLIKYLENMDYWVADDLATLYYKFYIFVNGYNTLLLNK